MYLDTVVPLGLVSSGYAVDSLVRTVVSNIQVKVQLGVFPSLSGSGRVRTKYFSYLVRRLVLTRPVSKKEGKPLNESKEKGKSIDPDSTRDGRISNRRGYLPNTSSVKRLPRLMDYRFPSFSFYNLVFLFVCILKSSFSLHR